MRHYTDVQRTIRIESNPGLWYSSNQVLGLGMLVGGLIGLAGALLIADFTNFRADKKGGLFRTVTGMTVIGCSGLAFLFRT